MSEESAPAKMASYFRRWQDIEDRKQELAEEAKELAAEIKGEGFDAKTTRAVFRDKRKALEDSAAVEEADAIYGLYWNALEEGLSEPRAPSAPAREKRKGNLAPEDRAARRKQRFSESMDDAKDLSARAAELGLIDPAAHAETVRIADALAAKLGNGPLPPHDEDGVLIEDKPETATGIVHKHTNINSTSPETAPQSTLTTEASEGSTASSNAEESQVADRPAGSLIDAIPSANPNPAPLLPAAGEAGDASDLSPVVTASPVSISETHRPDGLCVDAPLAGGDKVLRDPPAGFEPPAFIKADRKPINERCQGIKKDCHFRHYTHGVACSTCNSAWEIARRKERAAA